MANPSEISRREVPSWSLFYESINGEHHLEAVEWQNGEGVSLWNQDSGSRIDLCWDDIRHLRLLLKAIWRQANGKDQAK